MRNGTSTGSCQSQPASEAGADGKGGGEGPGEWLPEGILLQVPKAGESPSCHHQPNGRNHDTPPTVVLCFPEGKLRRETQQSGGRAL